MTKLYVPLMENCVTEVTRHTYLEYLQKINANTVMLVLKRHTLFMGAEEREAELQKIAEKTRFFPKKWYAGFCLDGFLWVWITYSGKIQGIDGRGTAHHLH